MVRTSYATLRILEKLSWHFKSNVLQQAGEMTDWAESCLMAAVTSYNCTCVLDYFSVFLLELKVKLFLFRLRTFYKPAAEGGL